MAVADAVADTGEKFKVVLGFDTDLVAKLKLLSLDESDVEIQKNTSDHKRFGNDSYEKWYAKDRTPFALVHSSGALAAIVWFGPKPLGRKSVMHLSKEEQRVDESTLDAGDWHTLSYRSYPPFRGRRLMKDFVDFATAVYLTHFPNAKLWAIINATNAGSASLASKLGYKALEEKSDPESLVMIRE